MKLTAFAAYLSCAITTNAEASAWVPRRGELYLQAGGALFKGDDPLLLGPSGLFGPDARTWSVELYADVGLGGNLALRTSARWVEHQVFLENGSDLSRSGFQDLELTVAWGPLARAHALCFYAGARVPFYKPQSDDAIRIGPGGHDLIFGAAYGRAHSSLWYQVAAQERLRFGGPSSGIDLRGELGTALYGPLRGLISLNLAPAFGRDQDRSSEQPSPIASVLALGAKLLLDFGAGFGAVGEVTWMPAILNDGPGLRAGVALSWARS